MTESSVEFVVGIESKSSEIKFCRLQITKKLGYDLGEMLETTKERMSKLDHVDFAVDRVFDVNMVCVLERDNRYTGPYYKAFMEVLNDTRNFPLLTQELDSSASIYGLIERTDDSYELGLRRRKFISRSAKKKFYNISGYTLNALSEKIFYLDNDFECIVDDNRIRCLGSGIIFKLLNLGQAVDNLLPNNIDAIEAELSCVDLSALKEMKTTIRRMATLAMRIVTTEEHKSWGESKFRESLESSGIKTKESEDGKIGPAEGHEYNFLRVIAKNIYRIEVDEDTYEVREATHSQSFEKTKS